MRSATFMLVLAFAVPSDAWADDPPEGREFLGVTEPSAGVVVQSQATGYLTRIAVNEGDAVAQGDLLVEIDPRPYQLALRELELEPRDVLFVAGSGFDLVGTGRVGLDTYWHNRVGLKRPENAQPPMHESRSLHDLVDCAIRGQGRNT